MTQGRKRMISIWTWSALILGVYGVLLLGWAVRRRILDDAQVQEMAHLQADLWWPVIMLVVAGGLLWAGLREQRGG